MSDLLQTIEGELHRLDDRDIAIEEWNARVAKAKDIAAAATTIPGSGTKAEVQELLSAMARPENANLQKSFRRMWRKLIEDGNSSPIRGAWGAFMEDEGEHVLSRLGATVMTLAAAAALAAITEVEQRRDRNLAQRQAQIDEGHLVVERAWTSRDVSWNAAGKVTFDCTNGKVAVGENLGARLLAFFAANRATLAKAA